MKILKLSELLKSEYAKYFTHEELYGVKSQKQLQFEANQMALNEGLILSHPIDKSIKVIENAGYEVVIFKTEKFNNRFFIEVNELHTDITKLFKITDNLGWYCAEIRDKLNGKIDNIKYTRANLKNHFEKYDTVLILFEPKFDVALNPYDFDYLYHFTKLIHLDRIKQYGLTPKTQNKNSIHPERVYLALTATAAEKFGRKAEVRVNKTKLPDLHNRPEDYNVGVILKIDVRAIPSYFKLYADPNYYKEGCFTLNTIPYSAIGIFKKFELDY